MLPLAHYVTTAFGNSFVQHELRSTYVYDYLYIRSVRTQFRSGTIGSGTSAKKSSSESTCTSQTPLGTARSQRAPFSLPVTSRSPLHASMCACVKFPIPSFMVHKMQCSRPACP